MKTKKRFLSILLSLVLVLGLFPGMSLTAYAAFWYSDLTPGTLILVGDTFSFDKITSFKFADYNDPSITHEVKGSDFQYNQATLSTTDEYYSFGSTKILPVTASPGGLLVTDYDSKTHMATFGVQNVTYEFDESTGTLSVGGTGVVPRYMAMTGDDYGVVGFTKSNLVKHLTINATNMIAIKNNAFMAYTGGCVLEDVTITSTSSTPLTIESDAFFYMKDSSVTITVDAKQLATVTSCPVNNYSSPVNLIYSKPAIFKKNALTALYGNLTVTFPTGCKVHVPAGPQFVESYLQEEYDHFASWGDEQRFWEWYSNLVEGTDYVIVAAHDEDLAPRNASLVVGTSNKAIFANVASTGVTLDQSAITIDADGNPVKLTATVTPFAATKWQPKWSVTGSSNVVLYKDSNCSSELGADEVAEVVYVKGTANDIATVTATTVDTNKTASCAVNHTHDFTYSASGATITATCTTDGCELPPSTQGGTDHAVTLTLSAADAAYTGSAYAGASLSNTTAWTGAGLTAPTIEYAGRGNTSYTKSTTAPTAAGTYTASITVDTDKTATKDFTISPMALTIDTATATNRAYDKDSTAVTISAVTFKDSNQQAVALTQGEDNDYTVTGAMTDANAGNGKTVNVTVTLKNANYSLATNTATTTVNISKAAARTIADVTDTLLYTATAVSETVAGKMPADAGELTYAKGNASTTGSVTVSDFTVNATSGDVTATLSGGAAGDTVTLPVTISSTNYADSAVNVKITLTAKSDAGVSISGAPASAKTYGDADFTLTGSVTNAGTGTGAWTWSTSDTAVFQITPNGAAASVKILKAGSATITASYESDTTTDTETTAAITVNTKTVTIQAKNQSIYVGGAVPTLVGADFYTVTGLVGTDTLTTDPTLKYQKNNIDVTPDNTTTGTYDIVPSGAAASANYSISYTNGTLTIAAPTEPIITGADLVLNGSLDFRFYVALPENFDASGAHMVFTIHGRTVDVPFSKAETSTAAATQGQKIFSCPVYSIEMAEPVEAVFHYTKGGEDKTTTRTASIKDYLDALDKQSGNTDALKALIAAVRNYGHYIQPYLARLHDFTVGDGGYAEMPAASGITPATAADLDGFKTNWNRYDQNLLESVTYYDTFDTSTYLNIQVKLKSARTLTAKVGGEAVEVTELGGNVYAVRTPGIAANSLGTPVNVVFSAGSTVICNIDVSALTYVRAVLASGRNEAYEIAALTAFYNYFTAAKDYAG